MTKGRNWLDWKPKAKSLDGTRIRGESPKCEDMHKLEVLPPKFSAQRSWTRLVQFAKSTLSEKPPVVDDVTARAINRLQGWGLLLPALQSDCPIKRSEFHELFEYFMNAKREGLYLDDTLPILCGGGVKVLATRLAVPYPIVGTEETQEASDA